VWARGCTNLMLQLHLESVLNGTRGVQQLSKTNRSTNTRQTRAAVRAKCTVTEYGRHVRELLRASVACVSPSCKQRATRGTAVGGLHLDNCDVVREKHTHCVIVGLIRCRSTPTRVAIARRRPCFGERDLGHLDARHCAVIISAPVPLQSSDGWIGDWGGGGVSA
jgi:hypothetical protein